MRRWPAARLSPRIRRPWWASPSSRFTGDLQQPLERTPQIRPLQDEQRYDKAVVLRPGVPPAPLAQLGLEPVGPCAERPLVEHAVPDLSVVHAGGGEPAWQQLCPLLCAWPLAARRRPPEHGLQHLASALQRAASPRRSQRVDLAWRLCSRGAVAQVEELLGRCHGDPFCRLPAL